MDGCSLIAVISALQPIETSSDWLQYLDIVNHKAQHPWSITVAQRSSVVTASSEFLSVRSNLWLCALCLSLFRCKLEFGVNRFQCFFRYLKVPYFICQISQKNVDPKEFNLVNVIEVIMILQYVGYLNITNYTKKCNSIENCKLLWCRTTRYKFPITIVI